ncbi:sugar phosphate isomerase/epimerase [Christensenellaceae bacterium NSJ-53]|uniref:Sugar phosphate isomerase/epimerase n=2 Tax=Gehongia tenuis TaxID=2763655 RepID=A0A926D4N5_9FIRM|nr:sugar phosphate isomerase/epimerase [Gehongia tenuis]
MAMKVGIQLYSVRNALAEDPYGTLAKVADIGFKYLEAANHDADNDDGVGFGVPADKLRKSLADLGMSIVGSHINPLKLERLPAVLDYHQELGNKQIGCDTEFYPYKDMDYLKRRCDLFNKVGEMCKERGMRYYYHNHYMECQRFEEGGPTIYEMVMENTDPSLVFCELDTYWFFRGGVNPIDYIKKYKDRLVLIHQKDFPENAPQPINMYDGIVDHGKEVTREIFRDTKDPLCFTEIGTGILPIQDIINAASDAPHQEYIVLEQDFTQLPELESIKRSMDAFHKFNGIEWA